MPPSYSQQCILQIPPWSIYHRRPQPLPFLFPLIELIVRIEHERYSREFDGNLKSHQAPSHAWNSKFNYSLLSIILVRSKSFELAMFHDLNLFFNLPFFPRKTEKKWKSFESSCCNNLVSSEAEKREVKSESCGAFPGSCGYPCNNIRNSSTWIIEISTTLLE